MKSQFEDGDAIPGWAAEFIAGAVKEGIVKGYRTIHLSLTMKLQEGSVCPNCKLYRLKLVWR